MLDAGKLIMFCSCRCKNVDFSGVWFAVLRVFYIYLVFDVIKSYYCEFRVDLNLYDMLCVFALF